MRVFGLIGNPLTHSFSGAYFEKKFRAAGWVDHAYHLYTLPDLDGFREWVFSISGLEGLNVTIPFKRAVLPLLDERKMPVGLDACNCIHILEGRLIGYNTDVIGFVQSLKPQLRSHHDRALVLGKGGAAEAVQYALRQLGIPFLLVGRDRGQDASMHWEELTPAVVEQHPLIINTTPLGTFPKTDEYPPLPYEGVGSGHLLYDLVYNPERTLFMQKGEERGAATQNGLKMLELQAEASWDIWNGRSIRQESVRE